jgi:Ca-activated chloride channel family protein
MQSLRTLSFGQAREKAVILLTDGYHNAGRISPKEAVARAKEKGVRIYTIGIGSKSDYDAALLETIAKETEARSYSAADAETLKAVFAQIDALEPSEIRGENYLDKRVLIFLPLLTAGALLLLWIFRTAREERA